jgi:hypothetical protein
MRGCSGGVAIVQKVSAVCGDTLALGTTSAAAITALNLVTSQVGVTGGVATLEWDFPPLEMADVGESPPWRYLSGC